MKIRLITVVVLLVHLSTMAQEPSQKRLLLNLNVMGQGVTQNYTVSDTSYFEDSNKNIDVHFKIGRYLFKEKLIAGFGLNFRSVNHIKHRSPRPPVEEFDPEIHYIETTEIQLGIFLRYKIFNELYVDTYAGFFGWAFNGAFIPTGSIGPIIKYKIGFGYSFDIWHFLAIEPNISLMNRRNLYRGREVPYDDVGFVSYGLGLAFKL